MEELRKRQEIQYEQYLRRQLQQEKQELKQEQLQPITKLLIERFPDLSETQIQQRAEIIQQTLKSFIERRRCSNNEPNALWRSIPSTYVVTFPDPQGKVICRDIRTLMKKYFQDNSNTVRNLYNQKDWDKIISQWQRVNPEIGIQESSMVAALLVPDIENIDFWLPGVSEQYWTELKSRNYTKLQNIITKYTDKQTEQPITKTAQGINIYITSSLLQHIPYGVNPVIIDRTLYQDYLSNISYNEVSFQVIITSLKKKEEYAYYYYVKLVKIEGAETVYLQGKPYVVFKNVSCIDTVGMEKIFPYLLSSKTPIDLETLRQFIEQSHIPGKKLLGTLWSNSNIQPNNQTERGFVLTPKQVVLKIQPLNVNNARVVFAPVDNTLSNVAQIDDKIQMAYPLYHMLQSSDNEHIEHVECKSVVLPLSYAIILQHISKESKLIYDAKNIPIEQIITWLERNSLLYQNQILIMPSAVVSLPSSMFSEKEMILPPPSIAFRVYSLWGYVEHSDKVLRPTRVASINTFNQNLYVESILPAKEDAPNRTEEALNAFLTNVQPVLGWKYIPEYQDEALQGLLTSTPSEDLPTRIETTFQPILFGRDAERYDLWQKPLLEEERLQWLKLLDRITLIVPEPSRILFEAPIFPEREYKILTNPNFVAVYLFSIDATNPNKIIENTLRAYRYFFEEHGWVMLYPRSNYVQSFDDLVRMFINNEQMRIYTQPNVLQHAPMVLVEEELIQTQEPLGLFEQLPEPIISTAEVIEVTPQETRTFITNYTHWLQSLMQPIETKETQMEKQKSMMTLSQHGLLLPQRTTLKRKRPLE